MIFLPCWIIKPGDYREITIMVQFTNCTASFGPPVPRPRVLATFSTRELAFLGKRTEAEPGLHRRCELTASRQYHALTGDGRAHGVEPPPDGGHAAQVDRYIAVDVEAR